MSADGNATPASSLIERDGAVETLMINDRPRNRVSLAFVGAGDKPLSEGIAAERGAVLATMGTPDQREGIQAFLEKRKPRFNRGS